MFQPYSTSYSRALFKYVANGFFARPLDADDFDFLEHVKVRGIANGSEANNHEVFLEELEFWQSPYAIASDVERRTGPLPAPEPKTPEELMMRAARSNLWHARRDLRKHERAMEQAELAREQAIWDGIQKTRKARELMSDIEWEKAEPKGQKVFGKTIDRHHVPQWKLDEMLEEGKAREQEIRAELMRQRAERQEETLAAALVEQEQMRQRVEEAHRAVAQLSKPVSEMLNATDIEKVHAKKLIVDLLRRSAPTMLRVDDVARVLSYPHALLQQCIEDLILAGEIRAERR